MNEDDFYKYSKILKAYVDFAKKLTETHHYRYSMVVDSSRNGTQCRYAKKTLQFAQQLEPNFLDLLKENEHLVPAALITTLDEIQKASK